MNYRYWDRFMRFWFAPADTIKLDTFRVLLGVALCVYFADWWQYKEEWLTEAGFHVSAQNLPYHSFWVPLLPAEFLPLFGLIFWGSLAAFILGWQLRFVKWIVLFTVSYVTFADQVSAFTLNKLAIASLAVLAASPHGAYWSLDKKKAAPVQSVWPMRILQLTLIIHYFAAGWDKAVYGEWLSNPYVVWSQVQGFYRTDTTAWLLGNAPLPLWALMQWSALAFELFSPLLFTWKATRSLALAWGFIFQMLVAVTMQLLIYFSLVMLSFYVFFISEERLRKIKNFLWGKCSSLLPRIKQVCKI